MNKVLSLATGASCLLMRVHKKNRMGGGGYLGIDESNHGRSPEIFVAVHSYNLHDLRYGTLPKRRGKRHARQLPSSSSYRHIIIPDHYKDIFRDEGSIRIAVVATCIRFFRSPDRVLVDGTPRENERDLLERILYPFPCPEVAYEPKADVHYPLVNEADRLASIIFRYYREAPKHKRGGRFSQTILTLCPEEYPSLMSPKRGT